MRVIRLAASAQADVVQILAWSQAQFGTAARLRYQRLITSALRSVAQDPLRPGSVARPELGDGVHTWRLRLSRDAAGTAGARVGRPRHFLVHRDTPTLLAVGRVLHEAMDPLLHIGPGSAWD